MGTKNNPGKHDCYAHAGPDEPIFVLRGTDRIAPFLVALWAEIRFRMGGASEEKIDEALQCASSMRRYVEALGKVPPLDALLETIGAVGSQLIEKLSMWSVVVTLSDGQAIMVKKSRPSIAEPMALPQEHLDLILADNPGTTVVNVGEWVGTLLVAEDQALLANDLAVPNA